MHRENYNSEVYLYLQVYLLKTKYIHECYLAEPGVRCSSHTSLSSICLLAGVELSAFSVSAYTRTEQHARTDRKPEVSNLYNQMVMMSVEQITYVTLWFTLIAFISANVSFSDMMQGDNGNIKEVLGITLFID